MMLDRGSQFVSKIQDSVCKLLKIKTKLSTAFHLETNGQSENANQEAERHLRSYVNHFQDNWVRLVLIGEFLANTNVSATTKVPKTGDYSTQLPFNQ